MKAVAFTVEGIRRMTVQTVRCFGCRRPQVRADIVEYSKITVTRIEFTHPKVSSIRTNP
jgi:hypothetical protein